MPPASIEAAEAGGSSKLNKKRHQQCDVESMLDMPKLVFRFIDDHDKHCCIPAIVLSYALKLTGQSVTQQVTKITGLSTINSFYM